MSKHRLSVVFYITTCWCYRCSVLFAGWRWPLDINADEHASAKAPLGRSLVLHTRKPRPTQVRSASTMPRHRSLVLVRNKSCFVRRGIFLRRLFQSLAVETKRSTFVGAKLHRPSKFPVSSSFVSKGLFDLISCGSQPSYLESMHFLNTSVY